MMMKTKDDAYKRSVKKTEFSDVNEKQKKIIELKVGLPLIKSLKNIRKMPAFIK